MPILPHLRAKRQDPPVSEGPNITSNTTADTPATSSVVENESISSSLGLSGVDLIAMVVSDSGLANAEPTWWNASPTGCILLGLQPRGGWQVMQRAVQWGADNWAHAFGVDCGPPVLYAYFACTIRNRLEMLDSPRFISPMVGSTTGAAWSSPRAGFAVKRPTKLIDGSRGGQAFVADVLAPEPGKHYAIGEQAQAQLLSVLLVGAGLCADGVRDDWVLFRDGVLVSDFDMGPGLGDSFRRLVVGLVVLAVMCVALDVTVLAAVWRNENIFGVALPYVVKITALATWAVGATGLFMLGGNPRVIITEGEVKPHVRARLDALREKYGGESGEPGEPGEPKQSLLDDRKGMEYSATGPEKVVGKVEVEVKEVPLSVDPVEPTHQAIHDPDLQPVLDSKITKDDGGSEPIPSFQAQPIMMMTTTEKLTSSELRPSEREIEMIKTGAVNATTATTATTTNTMKPTTTATATATVCPANVLVPVTFGSLHGSIFTTDRGHCELPLSIVERLAALDVRLARTPVWMAGLIFFAGLLGVAIALQVSATRAPAFWADLIGLCWLLATSVLRGLGVSGSEEWMIPRWKRRKGAANGAVLLGQFGSRTGGEGEV